MKTIKFFSVLSLALILFGVTGAFSKKTDPIGSVSLQVLGIQYHVSIHPALSAAPCNTYLVQVVDETGRLVAPAQVYVPGINGYSFVEKFSTDVNRTRRIAMLVEVKSPQRPICTSSLFTLPAIRLGPFLAGHLYTFDLYPKSQSFTTE